MELSQKLNLRERLVVQYLVLVEVLKQEDKFTQHNIKDQDTMRMNKTKTHSLEDTMDRVTMLEKAIIPVAVVEVVIVEVLEEALVEVLEEAIVEVLEALTLLEVEEDTVLVEVTVLAHLKAVKVFHLDLPVAAKGLLMM